LSEKLEDLIRKVYEREYSIKNDWELILKLLRLNQLRYGIIVEKDGDMWILKIPEICLKKLPALESFTRAKRKLKEQLRKQAIAELKSDRLFD